VDASQNVGIGTTSPSAKMDVAGSAYVRGDSSNATFTSAGQLAIKRSTGDPYMSFHGNTGSRIGYLQMQDAGLCTLSVEANQALSFQTNSAEAMRITSGNSLCVGTTSSLASARVSIKTPDGSGALIPLSLTVGLVSDGFGGISFRNPNGQQGSVSINSTTVSYNTTSDYRLKENAQPMTGALAKVAQLKPVTYQWKINGKDSEGFIAHELAEVCPHAVTGEKDAVDEDGNPKYQGIDTSFLVATLTAAIQEAKALIDTQAETLTQQTEAINALTARIVALETA
jgi:hypothetical protein